MWFAWLVACDPCKDCDSSGTMVPTETEGPTETAAPESETETETETESETETETESETETETETETESETETETESETETEETGSKFDPCGRTEGLDVTVSPSVPWTEHELLLDVTTSAAASVAVVCTLDGDPTERHLAESEEGTTHELRVSGLLADAVYTCEVAPTCPRLVGAPYAFTHRTGPAPADEPSLTPTSYGVGGGREYILSNDIDCWDNQEQRIVVRDREGRARWWFETPDWVGPSIDFDHRGGTSFSWGGGRSPNNLGRPRLVDLYDGEVWDSALGLPDYATSAFHHDGKQLADGRLITLEEVRVTGARGAFDGFQVRIVDPATSATVFTYNSQRGLDEGWLRSGTGDYWHANWVDGIDYGGGRREVYVSLRDMSQILALDETTGDHLWTFGQNGDFDLVDPAGASLPNSALPNWQHGLSFDGTTLLVYNNGVDDDESSAIAYELDLKTMVATRLWEWTEPDWYQAYLGSVDWLPSGNVLIGMGHPECFATNPGDTSTIVEIDPVAGDKVWQLAYDDPDLEMYRADWADPCDLFANAKYCDTVGARIEELRSSFEPCHDPGDDRDDDGDGFTTCTDLDCDDADPAIHPGAVETCDGLDEDCDGLIDDGHPVDTWYPDGDGDGFGDASAAVDACVAPAGAIDVGGDCDDSDPAVHPDATEVCGGGDEDCSGVADDLPECWGCIDEPPYVYCEVAADWVTAESSCAALGGRLVVIEDAAENSAVSGRSWGLERTGWWIGLSDRAVEGTMEWEDGTGLTYTNWYPGEPNDWAGNEDCVGTNYLNSGRWNDWPCADSLPFVCER